MATRAHRLRRARGVRIARDDSGTGCSATCAAIGSTRSTSIARASKAWRAARRRRRWWREPSPWRGRLASPRSPRASNTRRHPAGLHARGW